MPGDVIRVVPKTFVSFTNVPNNSGNVLIWLARRIHAEDHRELTLIVRLHAGTVIAGTWVQPPAIAIAQDGYTDEDPSAFTNGSAAGFTNVLITGPAMANMAAGFMMQSINVPPGAGGLLAVAISAQTGSGCQADLYISADLSRKV